MVSIVTVCYNSESTIADTIKSIQKQTYGNIEYIIVDGKSTDATNDIINEYSETVSMHVSEKDSGLYDAMNKGIELASGDIVGILNSDDVFFDSNAVQSIVDCFCDNDNLDAIYADVGFYDKTLASKVRHYSSAGFSVKKLKFGIMPAHPSLYIRRSLFELIGSYSTSYKIAADFDFVVRLFLNSKVRSFYLQKELVKMRVGGISTSGFDSSLLLNKEILQSLHENGISSSYFHLALKYPKKALGFLVK